jgi:hypothetical protein
MSAKRATVPGDALTRRPTALDKLTGRTAETDYEEATVEPQNSETVLLESGETSSQQFSNTVIQENSNTVSENNSYTGKQQNGNTAKAGEKISFYLRADQVDRLDELVLTFKKRTGKRINRNDIVRQLVDQCDLDTLVQNWK